MLVLVETNDLGSALLYFGIFLAMLYVATGRALYVGDRRCALPRRARSASTSSSAHVRDRVTIWLHPWTDHAVYCALNGKLAAAPGLRELPARQVALLGRARRLVRHRASARAPSTTDGGHQLIPYLNTDFIYSALAQELGLVGVAALLLVYMLFVARGFKIAMLAEDGFSKLLAVGLTFAFALQTFIIVGGILRIIPLTGITLPFVSYGGSSVVANFVLLAGLLLVSNRANAERAMNRQIARLALVGVGLLAALIVGDDLLADLGQRRASPTGRTTRSSAWRSSRSSAA